MQRGKFFLAPAPLPLRGIWGECFQYHSQLQLQYQYQSQFHSQSHSHYQLFLFNKKTICLFCFSLFNKINTCSLLRVYGILQG